MCLYASVCVRACVRVCSYMLSYILFVSPCLYYSCIGACVSIVDGARTHLGKILSLQTTYACNNAHNSSLSRYLSHHSYTERITSHTAPEYQCQKVAHITGLSIDFMFRNLFNHNSVHFVAHLVRLFLNQITFKLIKQIPDYNQ